MENQDLYIQSLETRIRDLEMQMSMVKSQPFAMQLPKTNLLSPNYLTRAFAVWGHMWVASFLISLMISVGSFIIMLIISLVATGGLALFSNLFR